jgi:hypothetical protein
MESPEKMKRMVMVRNAIFVGVMMAGLTFNLVLVVAYVVFGTLMSLCLLLEWADNSNREQKSSMKEKEHRNSVLSQD